MTRMDPMVAELPARDQVTVGFLDAMRAEWVKIRTLRSTYWSLLAAVVLVVGLGAVFALAYGANYSSASPAEKATFDPTTISLSGVWFAQLAIGVLGILTITAEHASGTIRPSLAAVPRRGRMFAAKAAVFAGITLVTSLVASFGAFFVSQPILAHKAPHVSIGDPEVLRAVVGAGLYLAGLALFCVALGALIRHTAGAVALMVAVVFAVPTVLGALPPSWQEALGRWMPTNAGSSVWTVYRTANTFSAWTGFGVFLGYVVVLLLIAFALFARRDA